MRFGRWAGAALLAVTFAAGAAACQDLSSVMSAIQGAASGRTPSQADLDRMIANSREIVGKVGTAQEKRDFDAQLQEADDIAARSARTEAETRRIERESAERRQIAAREEARAQEVARAQAWEEQQKRLREKPTEPPGLPSREGELPRGEKCVGDHGCTVPR